MDRFEAPIETVANRLNYAMSVRGMKQADIIAKTGIASGALSQYVSGKVSPKQDRIYILAKVLSVNEAWLMGFDVPMDRVISKETSCEPAIASDVQDLIDNYSKLDAESKIAIRTIVANLVKKVD